MANCRLKGCDRSGMARYSGYCSSEHQHEDDQPEKEKTYDIEALLDSASAESVVAARQQYQDMMGNLVPEKSVLEKLAESRSSSPRRDLDGPSFG